MKECNEYKNCLNKKEDCKTSPYAEGIKELKIRFWEEISNLCFACIQELRGVSKKTKCLCFLKDKVLIPAKDELEKENKNPILLDFLAVSGYLNNPAQLNRDIGLLNRGIKHYWLFFEKAEFSAKEKGYLIALFYNLSLKSETKIKELTQ